MPANKPPSPVIGRQHRSLAASPDSTPRSLRQRLADPGPLFGLTCSTPSPTTVELIAAAGYDYLIVDVDQLVPQSNALADIATAARHARIALLAKVVTAAQTRQAVGHAVSGIVLSRVCCPLQAAAAVRDCRQAMQVLRAQEHASHAWLSFLGRSAAPDELPLLLAAIEDGDGVACAGEIAAVDGIDILMESTTALSHALQLPWQTRHPSVQAAGRAVRLAAQAAGKQFCAHPQAPIELDAALEDDVRLFVLGDDRVISRRAMSNQLERYRWRSGESNDESSC
ncbi:aldolase/citrate lyase family protein [Herbaspirillum sp. alder98]|uniref:aldolase/citrate lyase family protein n=1 Tax=Herbaspirillum sp. alder98 TaxID=2913096 RepID=UPI001CD8D228|nr:aldolase/citrate lyase family protein [Herbaspirillum sp. alder98]MCA1324935.1 siderophore biosynthesis protein SbnG [Herbaspirillum sp. alder98]